MYIVVILFTVSVFYVFSGYLTQFIQSLNKRTISKHRLIVG